MNADYRYEALSDSIQVCVSSAHRFGTDAFLLAHFAAPKHKDTVCDLGTGCGIIPMAMMKNSRPKKIVGVELQKQAFEQFLLSIAASNMEAQVHAVHADICRIAAGEETDTLLSGHSFDLVTCNPPYKAENAGILSGTAADKIARHETCCTIYDVCRAAARLLKFGGRLCVCQRPERLCDVIAAMREANIEPKRLRFVAKTAQDIPWLFLIEGKKGSKPFLQLEPILAVQGKNGFSDELLTIYGGFGHQQDESCGKI